ncbi:MAG: hypothetical protein HY611_06100 [Elusimicrobia bacterium]|nr:hypothetical protein [Elusimicrobiota bacterium]
MIREAPQVLRLSAHVGGVVTEVIEGWGAVVETFGARIQGAYGVGGETHGPLHITDALTPEDRGKILVVDAPAGAALLQRAAAAGVAGLILGGLPDADLAAFLGEELDPSVSGAQTSAMTIVLTEGFGRLAIAGPTLRLLKNFEGAEASLSGHTHIRAGTVRPEIILARTPSRLPAAAAAAPEPAPPVGRRIRILRGPEAWKIARVAAAPKAPQTIDTESPVRVFDALLEDGRICRVPRANVEFLEAPAKISKI